jgi:hypothetical protein
VDGAWVWGENLDEVLLLARRRPNSHINNKLPKLKFSCLYSKRDGGDLFKRCAQDFDRPLPTGVPFVLALIFIR